MKKFLSIALALAMTLSLAVVGASAKDFTDKDKINYKEAVDVVSAVKIIDGYTDGSFNPANTLTRGAAAKIICNMVLGPTTAASLGVSTAPFKDVSTSNVFAGYIAYCAKQGIINGYADKTFRPAGTVTGYQFLKMLLGALGYDGAIEGFSGSNWEVNVAKLAASLGLYTGNDKFVGTKAMTREEACLYAFNTLTSNVVDYSNKGTEITINGVTIRQGASKAEAVKSSKDSNTIYDETSGNASATTPDVVQFAERYFPSLVLYDNVDSIGRAANVWTNGSTKVGTYATKSATLTYTSKVSATTMAANLKGYEFLNGTTKAADLYVNGVFSANSITSASAVAALTGAGKTVEIYTAGINIYRVVVINTYIAKVAGVDATAKKNTYSVYQGASAITVKSETGYGTFAKDAYVVVTPVFSTGTTIDTTKDLANVVAATKISGKATYVNSDNDTITVDSKNYSLAANAAKGDATYSFGTDLVGKNVDLYADANGYVLLGTEASSTANYIFVIKSWATTDTYGKNVAYVQGVTADGKVVVYPIVTDDSFATLDLVRVKDAGDSTDRDLTKGTYIDGTNAKLLAYTMSGSKIALTAVDGTYADKVDTTTAIASTAKKVTTAVDNKSAYYGSDVKFVLANKTGADATAAVVNGTQAIAQGATAYAIHTDDTNNNSTVTYVYVYGTTAVSTKDMVFVGDKASNGKNENGYTFDAYVNGEAKTITYASASLANANNFYTYSVDAKGVYTLTPVADASGVYANAQLTNVYNNLVTVAGGTVTDFDATNAKVIDLTGNKVASISDLRALFNVANKNSGKVNVSVAYDAATKTVSYIYVTDTTFIAPTLTAASKAITAAAVPFAPVGCTTTYAWSKASTVSGTYAAVTVADATSAVLATTGTDYYKAAITVKTVEGYTFSATCAAVQAVA